MKAIRFMDPGVIEYSEIPQPEIRDEDVYKRQVVVICLVMIR